MTCLSCRPHSGSRPSITCCSECLQEPALRIAQHNKEIARVNELVQTTTEKWWRTFQAFPDNICDRFSDMQSTWMFSAQNVKRGDVPKNNITMICGCMVTNDVAEKINRTINRDSGMAKIWKMFHEYLTANRQFNDTLSQHRLAIAILTDELEKRR